MNEEQATRLEALQGAASVLGRKSEGAFKAASHPEVTDLVDVAEYIVSGLHPLGRYEVQP